MAPKVHVGDVVVDLETVEQVAELIRLLGRADQPVRPATTQSAELPLFAMTWRADVPPAEAPRPRLWDRESAWKFLSSLSGTARGFMSSLMVAKSMGSGEMAKKLNVEPNLLGPAIRSIKTKVAALEKNVPFEVKDEEGRSGKIYSLTPEFYGAASQPAPGGAR